MALELLGKPLGLCRPSPRGVAVKGRGKLSNEPQSGVTRTVIRKRRSRRHRRNRRIRRALLVFACAVFTFVLSLVALQFLSPSVFHAARNAEPDRNTAEASRNLLLTSQKEVLRQMEGRPVYRYSVVPGGVRDVQELKWAAEHDPVVAEHYRGFDYDHARVVRLALAQTAYVSYRIGSKVYWTRHRVSLKKGETVITDGTITARTRCANRVEELPKQGTSESEPPAAKFDERLQPDSGMAMIAPPVPYQSALMNRDPVPGLGPAVPLSSYDPIANGGFPPILPPPLPGVCGIETKKKQHGHSTGGEANAASSGDKKKKKGDPCGHGGGGGGEVPEPGTWLLMASGAAGVYWKARHKFPRLSSSPSDSQSA
jgi:PEP-CTERM motif-containing protein